MGTVKHRYYLIPLTESGETLDQSAELDDSVFAPAIEWTHFCGIRKHILPPFSSPAGWAIVPRWTGQEGPYIEGFDVQITGESDTVVFSESFTIGYFRQHVRCFIQQKSDDAAQGPSIFRICAVPVDNERACNAAGSSFSIKEIKKSLGLKEVPLGYLLQSSTRVHRSGSDVDSGIDMPVFITKEVISEAIQVSQDSGENEAGGVLTGYLCRGSDVRGLNEIFVVITSQIRAPVDKEDSGQTRIRFRPETWSYFREALRDRDEMMIAWWHSHPFMKNICTDKRQCNRQPICTPVFFSTSDMQFHRVAFYQAYHTALVIGDTPCPGMNYGLFGWRKGEIVTRDFCILHKTSSELQGIFL